MHLLFSRSIRCGLAVGLLFMAGCATTTKPVSQQTPSEEQKVTLKGIDHKVKKGETLWRIAKTYKISVEEIIRANNIPNAASIEESQLLLIPGADAAQDVIIPTEPGKDNDFAWPVRGKVVSYFEDRRGAVPNRGIDIRISDEEVVKASRDGKVVFADHLAGYGFAVILDHADDLYTVYGRNEKILVALGDYVFRGEKIAVPGRENGQAVSHFEIRKGSTPSNPLYYLP